MGGEEVGAQAPMYREPSVVASVRCAGDVPTRNRARRVEAMCRGTRAAARGAAAGTSGVGGPPPCGHSALDGAVEHGREAGRYRCELGCITAGAPVEDEVGASRSGSWSTCFQPGCPSAVAATNPPAVADREGSRSNETASTFANPSSVDGCSSSRRARIWEVGASTPGSRRASSRASRAMAARQDVRAAARRG